MGPSMGVSREAKRVIEERRMERHWRLYASVKSRGEISFFMSYSKNSPYLPFIGSLKRGGEERES